MKRSGAPGLRSRGIYRTKDRGLPSIIPVLTEKLPVVSGGAAMAEERKLVVANTASAAARVIPSQPHIVEALIAFPPRNFGEIITQESSTRQSAGFVELQRGQTGIET